MTRIRSIFLILLTTVLFTNIASGARGKNGNRWDKVPDAFTFIDQVAVPVLTLVQSNTVTISGINTATEISVSGGEYAVNGGAFTAVAGDVNPGDTVSLRQTSSGSSLASLPLSTSRALLQNGFISHDMFCHG